MKDYIRIFGRKVKRSSTVYKGIRLISHAGPLIGPILAPKNFEVNTIDLPLQNLPEGLNGLKILHLSDIHAGDYVRREFIQKLVRKANTLDPDIVAITGDFSEVEPDSVLWAAEELSRLSNRYGIYGVLGNHDIWNGDDFIQQVLEDNNIKVLRNENISLIINQEKLILSGIDDYIFGKYDIEQAFQGITGEDVHIFLSHNPDVIEEIDGYKVDLMLSGHIHGGQWNLPFVGVLYIPSKFGDKHAWGLSQSGNTYVYTSKGIGSTSIPVRINCPPEITLIRPVRAEENKDS